MNIWSAREESIQLLATDLKPQKDVIEEGFKYIGILTELFQSISREEGASENGKFCRICGLTLAKFSHLLLGIYSLTIDGLSQEAGAFLRPAIETYELLVYFRQDKSRVNQILEGKLPSAGIIGKKISGNFQDLREFLNSSSSHFSYKIESVWHLFGEHTQLKATPTSDSKTLFDNLQIINAFQIGVLLETIECLLAVNFDVETLPQVITNWSYKSEKIFTFEK